MKKYHYSVEVNILAHKKVIDFSSYEQAYNYCKELCKSYENLKKVEKELIFIDIKKVYEEELKKELKKTFRSKNGTLQEV